MKIVFVSDAFHHHQKGVADALFELTEGSYRFITTLPLREERKKMGFANAYPQYVVDASDRNPKIWREIQNLIDDTEVVVLGSAPYELLTNRLKAGRLTFRYSERLWKEYKHYLKTPFYMLNNHKTLGCRMLCASAYAAHDYNTMGAFRGMCYKWGYFTEIREVKGERLKVKDVSNPIKFMWCSRYLDWKHPELVLYLANSLKEKGYAVQISMYGSGTYFERSVALAKKLKVEDCVAFKGNVANTEIMKSMQESDIFLFTSDRAEGWGAVANESMSNGCVLVASDEIGSIPYLIKDKENGCTFRSSSRRYGFGRFGVSVDKIAIASLTEKVEWLIQNPLERTRLSVNAIQTMQEMWNPRKAAENLLQLIEDFKQGCDTSIVEGPCSKA